MRARARKENATAELRRTRRYQVQLFEPFHRRRGELPIRRDRDGPRLEHRDGVSDCRKFCVGKDERAIRRLPSREIDSHEVTPRRR